jgi:hypothetical protein
MYLDPSLNITWVAPPLLFQIELLTELLNLQLIVLEDYTKSRTQ